MSWSDVATSCSVNGITASSSCCAFRMLYGQPPAPVRCSHGVVVQGLVVHVLELVQVELVRVEGGESPGQFPLLLGDLFPWLRMKGGLAIAPRGCSRRRFLGKGSPEETCPESGSVSIVGAPPCSGCSAALPRGELERLVQSGSSSFFTGEKREVNPVECILRGCSARQGSRGIGISSPALEDGTPVLDKGFRPAQLF